MKIRCLALLTFLVSFSVFANDCGKEHPESVLKNLYNVAEIYGEDYTISKHNLAKDKLFYFYRNSETCGSSYCETVIFYQDANKCWKKAGVFEGYLSISENSSLGYKQLNLEFREAESKILEWNSKEQKYEER